MRKYFPYIIAAFIILVGTVKVFLELELTITLPHIDICWWRAGIITILGILFLLANELEDESVRNNWKKNKKFFNSKSSSRNKWAKDKNGRLIPYTKKWYHFGVKAGHEEAFPFSSTVLVFLTDGEHLFQWFKKRFIEIGFFVAFWQFGIAWMLGTAIMQFVKEKFIKFIH